MENLGTRAKARREELGLTQLEVARRAGISQSTIAQIESGRNTGSKYIVRLAAALNTSVLWLSEGKTGQDASLTITKKGEDDTGPLRYDVKRAMLLSSKQRRLIERILSTLLYSMSVERMANTSSSEPNLIYKRFKVREPKRASAAQAESNREHKRRSVKKVG